MFAELHKETMEMQDERERQQKSHHMFTHSPDLSAEVADKKLSLHLHGSVILPNPKTEKEMANSFLEGTGLFESSDQTHVQGKASIILEYYKLELLQILPDIKQACQQVNKKYKQGSAKKLKK